MPKGKRVTEHQPGYGDQAGNGKGLNAGGRAFLEAGETTCTQTSLERKTHVRRMASARPVWVRAREAPPAAQRPHHCEGCGRRRVATRARETATGAATVKEHDARKRHKQDKGAADDDEGGVARVSTPIISSSLG